MLRPGKKTKSRSTKLKADVAWLRMVHAHVKSGLDALRDKKPAPWPLSSPDQVRISNAIPSIDNAVTYIEDMIEKSLGHG